MVSDYYAFISSSRHGVSHGARTSWSDFLLRSNQLNPANCSAPLCQAMNLYNTAYLTAHSKSATRPWHLWHAREPRVLWATRAVPNHTGRSIMTSASSDKAAPVPQFPSKWAWRRLSLGMRAGAAATYSWAFTPLIALVGLLSFPIAISAYVTAELVFWVVQKRKHQALGSMERVGAVLTKESPLKASATLQKVLSSMEQLNFSCITWLRIWFKGAEPQDIRRDNLADMLAAALWCSSSQAVKAAGFGADLETMVDMLDRVCLKQHQLEQHQALKSRPLTMTSAELQGADSLGPPRTPSSSMALHKLCSQPSLPAPDVSSSETDSSIYEEEFVGESTQGSSASLSRPDAELPTGSATPTAQQPNSPSHRFFQPGHNASVSYYEHQPTPLPHWYRPLVVYMAFDFMAWMNHNMLTWAGFTKHNQGSVVYYTYRMGPQRQQKQKPLLFLHGVGMGLLPYVKVLLTLASTDAPIIAVEYKHVGQRWCKHIPGLEELCRDVQAIVQRHECSADKGGVHVVAHSFGSALMSLLMQANPGLVQSLSLMDPVCFHMWVPSLLVNFVYRPATILNPEAAELLNCSELKPEQANETETEQNTISEEMTLLAYIPKAIRARVGQLQTLFSWIPVVMKDFFIIGPAREMHCTTAVCRLMDWRDASMWAHQMPPAGRCIIALAEEDELLPAPLLARWARTHTTASVRMTPRIRHADILVFGQALDPLVVDIYQMAYGEESGESGSGDKDHPRGSVQPEARASGVELASPQSQQRSPAPHGFTVPMLGDLLMLPGLAHSSPRRASLDGALTMTATRLAG